MYLCNHVFKIGVLAQPPLTKQDNDKTKTTSEMSKMKLRDGGRHFSWRAILSTIAGESLDSLIFFPLALGGVVPTPELPKLMLWQVVLKTLYEVIALPITIRVVKTLKAHEGEDVYDEGVNYSIWKVFTLQ